MTNPSESIAAHLAAQAGMQRVPSAKAELFQRRRFVDANLAAALIALIDADRRPSTIADDNGDAYFRTSETCDLPAHLPAVQRIEAMLAQLSGIDPAFGEPLQGQRYAEGQEFKPHTDYFAPDGRDYQRYCALSGNRTWTFMVYLNDVVAGGPRASSCWTKPSSPRAASCCAGTTVWPTEASTMRRSTTG